MESAQESIECGRTDRELRAAVGRASADTVLTALVSSIIALIVATPLDIATIWLVGAA